MANLLNDKAVNRREFFKYAIGGAIVSGTASYSPPSHAFAFTAAAILTGEKIGWAAYPPMQIGKEFVQSMYRQQIQNSTATEMQTVYQSKDLAIQQLSSIEETCFGMKIEPISDFCTYSDAAKESLKIRNKRKSLNSDLSNGEVSGNQSIASVSEIATGIAKYLDDSAPITPNDIDVVSMTFQKLSHTKDTVKKPKYMQIPQFFRQQLMTAALNEELTTKLTNSYQGYQKKLDATYHSKEWREKMNSTAAEVTLYTESLSQKATENSLLFDLLMAKQIALVIRSLETIAMLEKGQYND